jgi:hypothetical protein
MKHAGGLILVSVLALGLGACGKKDEAKGGGGEGGGGGGAAAAATCTEANDVKVAWNADEMYAPGEFEHTHTIGFLSGMVWNGKSLQKMGHVVLANYDVKLGPYMIELPKEPGHQAIIIKFKTAAVPTTAATNKDDYAKLSLAKGAQASASGSDAGFDVSYFVGGQNSAPELSSSRATGSANLTSVDGSLCGTIDFTSPKGSTFKGTFNAKILEDLWAK